MGKVLIFDDDKDILELCSLILSRRGFVTSGETSCKDVIHKIQEVKPDVILMDNWIPDIGGDPGYQIDKKDIRRPRISPLYFSQLITMWKIFHTKRAQIIFFKSLSISSSSKAWSDKLLTLVWKHAGNYCKASGSVKEKEEPLSSLLDTFIFPLCS